MTRLYLDNQYPKGLVDVIKALHEVDPVSKYEIVHGVWPSDNAANFTVLFMMNTSNKGADKQIMDLYDAGFKVFVFRKPYGKPYNPFKHALYLMANWKNILDKIESEPGPFLYSIGYSKKVITKLH